MNDCQVIRMLGKDNKHGNIVNRGFEQFRHWHSDTEYIYVEKGNLLIELDGRNVKLTEGQMLIVAGNVIHTFIESEEESVIYVIRIPMGNINILKHAQFDDVAKLFENCLLIQPTKKMVEHYHELVFLERNEYNELYITCGMIQFAIMIYSNRTLIKEVFDNKKVEFSEVTVQIQEFIEKSLHQTCTLTMLANHLGMSKSHCSKIIKQKTKFGFTEYVNQVRLREAEKYIRITDMQMIEISNATGFNSIQSFNRNFKKYCGVTPTSYRKKMRGV
jgi:AraC-type DNA-binding domain-containing proteins